MTEESSPTETAVESPSTSDETEGKLPVLRHRRSTVALLGLVVSACAVAALLGRHSSAALGVDLGLVPGLVVAFGLLFGPIGAWGAAIGHLVAEFLSGTVALDTVVRYLARFALAMSAYRLWGAFGPLSSGERPGHPTARNLVEYGLVAVTAASFAVGITAWGSLLLGESTFSAVVAGTLPEYLLSAVTVGPVVLYALSSTADRRGLHFSSSGFDFERDGGRASDAGTGDAETTDARPRGSGALVLAFALGWLFVGHGIGAVFQAAELEYPHIFVNRIGRPVLVVLRIAGPGGLYLQVVSGAAFLTSCLWGVYRAST